MIPNKLDLGIAAISRSDMATASRPIVNHSTRLQFANPSKREAHRRWPRRVDTLLAARLLLSRYTVMPIKNPRNAFGPMSNMKPALLLKDRQKSSKPFVSINPFEPRPGHYLSWNGVDVKVSRRQKHQHDTLHILCNLSGVTKPSELTCIMGESGSGKTTLLDFLAGRLASSVSKRGMDVKGDIYMDGEKIDPTSIAFQRKVAYTEQHDNIFATATPREAIYFAARLRLSRTIGDEDIAVLTDSILDELHLSEVADSLIGGDHLRGLSGGEKRRVALGVQLVIRPSMLLLDEVTSGLDSKNAASVIMSCKKVAESGATVIMVIHQPSSDIFSMMDKLILLERGRCMYNGATSDVPAYFELRGFPVPAHYNPADWIIKVQLEIEASGYLSVQLGSDDNTAVSMTRRTGSSSDTEEFQRVSLWKETAEQVRRDTKNLTRDGMGLLIRFGTLTAGSALLAIAYAGVGSDSLDSVLSFSSHVGALFLVLVSSLIILQLTIVDFSLVREVYVKELKTDHYRIFSLGLTKTLYEAWSTFLQCLMVMLVIYWSLDLNGRFWYLLLVLYAVTMANLSSAIAAGCVTSNPADAKELMPMVLFPQLLFSGFFVNIEDMPKWIAWMQYLMPMTYAFRLAIAEEFADCFDVGSVFCIEYLESQDATGSEDAEYWMALLILFAGVRCLAFLLLRRRARCSKILGHFNKWRQ